MKISKRVLNTEFVGSPQSVNVLQKHTACGDGLPAIAQIPSLSGVQGFFDKYVPVFLAGKNVYRK